MPGTLGQGQPVRLVLALCIIGSPLCIASASAEVHAKRMEVHAEYLPRAPIPVIYEGITLSRPIPRSASRLANPLAPLLPASEPLPKLNLSSVRGTASWYCKAGVSICHHSYPPGSMVAAACGKLRRAMGPTWRGDRVTVSSGGHAVSVKLVDWCGSRTKLIDLYWEPMRRLGGSGTLPVVVRW